MSPPESTLDDLLREDRRFPPPERFTEQAHASDPGIEETAKRLPSVRSR
jgi:hypothetical protein